MVGQQTYRSTNMHPTYRWNSSGLWTPQIAAQQQQPFFKPDKPLSKTNVTSNTGVEKSAKTNLRIISHNCKNIKTCGPLIHKLLFNNDIILIQEHWLFQAQIHLINELHEQINYAAKGVDINDPL